ncbi:MAG: hypothetical protein R3330_14095, partial [Saprospiraceae bacterium]|nr:hypothetical protein [Saprospiraceae bacterium]
SIDPFLADEKTRQRIALEAVFADYRNELGNIRRMIDQVTRDPGISPDMKQVTIENLREYERRLLESSNLKYLRSQVM